MNFGRFAFLFLASAALPRMASASCGSATCPLDNQHYLGAGWFHFMLAHEYIDQNRIFVGSSPSFVGALPNSHDEIQTVNQRTLFDAQYSVTNTLALNVEIPFIQRSHSHLESGSIENFDFSGFGDIVVGAQYALLLPEGDFDPYLSVHLGAKLPTGVTNAAGTGGEVAEVTIQPGTGSLDAIAALSFRQNLFSVPTLSGEYGALPITAGVSFQKNGRGTNDYRVGNTLLLYLGTQYQLNKQFSALLQADGMFRGYADVGSTGEFAENTGGTWIFMSPGLKVHLSNAFSAFGYVQLPVYINVHGIQQASRLNLQLGVTADIDMFRQ